MTAVIRWDCVRFVALAVGVGIMAAFGMFLMSLAFGRSIEATVHASLASFAYLVTGLIAGRYRWLP